MYALLLLAALALLLLYVLLPLLGPLGVEGPLLHAPLLVLQEALLVLLVVEGASRAAGGCGQQNTMSKSPNSSKSSLTAGERAQTGACCGRNIAWTVLAYSGGRAVR